MTKLFILLSALVLAGCGTQQIKTVDVAVPVPCVDKKPEKPALVTDAELKAMTDYQLTLALWKDRKQRANYTERLEVVIDFCSRLKGKP